MRSLLLLCGVGAAVGFAPAFLGRCILPRAAKSAFPQRGADFALRAPEQRASGICALRAEAEDTSKETSKKLADAWIANDKANELKGLLGGSSLYLIGFPGCGKEGVGAMLAKRMDVYSFLDLKEVFSAASGKPECGSYQELMDAIGEEDFRDLESKVMDQVQAVLRLVVSTDAGVVSSVSNWARMQNGLVIYLQSDSQTLAKKSGLPVDKIQAMMAQHENFYDLADVKVAVTSDDAIDNTAIAVIDTLLDLIKNNPPKRKEWQKEHDKRIAALEKQEEEERKKGKPGEPPGKGFAPKSGNI